MKSSRTALKISAARWIRHSMGKSSTFVRLSCASGAHIILAEKAAEVRMEDGVWKVAARVVGSWTGDCDLPQGLQWCPPLAVLGWPTQQKQRIFRATCDQKITSKEKSLNPIPMMNDNDDDKPEVARPPRAAGSSAAVDRTESRNLGSHRRSSSIPPRYRVLPPVCNIIMPASVLQVKSLVAASDSDAAAV
jgi:hypothetical protein